ncbi:hypothetical protein [Seonamhaeicola sp. S2-3]|uniref:DUF6985 domain-containing protein n=1 Tax=Seonamhaeicola sp. S2-3 TaxID=1936081 RepID=UPI0018DE6837|nr:hypothetical protein [Seonamhaeicola sp. S2-3]
MRETLGNENQHRELNGIEGEIYLSSWNEFENKKSDFLFEYSIGGDSILETEEIKTYQHKANEYLIKNEEGIKNEILNALVIKYPEIQDIYDFEPDEKKELMPDVIDPNDFKKLIELIRIHFLNIKKDDIGYIGFEFDCKWDIEHGLGIMIHKNRIIKIGGADTSFMEWIAEEDLLNEE